jgi:hypothetical protein
MFRACPLTGSRLALVRRPLVPCRALLELTVPMRSCMRIMHHSEPPCSKITLSNAV